MNVVEYLLEKSKTIDKTAIYQGKTETSYPELCKRVRAVSAYLHSARTSDNVLLISDNSAFCVESYLGTMGAGKVSVPIHPKTSDENIKFIIESCKIKTAFIQKRYVERFADFIPGQLENIVVDEPVESCTAQSSLPSSTRPFADVPDMLNQLKRFCVQRLFLEVSVLIILNRQSKAIFQMEK